MSSPSPSTLSNEHAADSSLTLRALIHALCPAAQIHAGENSVTRAINWVVTLSPGSTPVRADDFVILLPPYSPDLASTLAILAARGAVGAAVLGAAPRATNAR